ncbi:MAG TPA: hypothetical protein VM580_32910 [Labilithrix sp.]|nr:hypothetical protein [Labilithrix sp.]
MSKRLIGDGLELEAAPGEDHRVRTSLANIIEEAAEESALADPGGSAGQRYGLPTGGRFVEQAQELALLSFTSDKRFLMPARCVRRSRLAGRIEPLQDLVPTRPSEGVSRQERSAKIVQVFRDIGSDGTGARRVARLLGRDELGGAAFERRAPGERLEEHGADRIPVARRVQRLLRALLRGHVHVQWGPRAQAISGVRDIEIDREPEVEEHQTPALLHEDVGRLDVTMQFARPVQGKDPVRELA